MTEPALTLTDLQVQARNRTLLDIPSFNLHAGEVISLVGPNGSGKTTFLHCAALLRRIDAGHITILGETASERNANRLRRQISLVFQDPLLFSVDVLRNAAAGLRFHGVPRTEANRRAMEWLRLFGVASLATRTPRGLSGGEAARVALARAFATNPRLLLLDEPFSALDAGSRAVLIPELRERLHERDAAAILVTHEQSEAFAFADRLVLLDNGQVIADGNAQTLAMRPPSLRAATLLGMENLLPGWVVSHTGTGAMVELTAGRQVCGRSAQPLGTGARVNVAIPAVAARLLRPSSPAPDGWNALPARITGVTSSPGWHMVTADGGIPLRVRQAWEPDGPAWVVEAPVLVTFPPDAAWILPDTP